MLQDYLNALITLTKGDFGCVGQLRLTKEVITLNSKDRYSVWARAAITIGLLCWLAANLWWAELGDWWLYFTYAGIALAVLRQAQAAAVVITTWGLLLVSGFCRLAADPNVHWLTEAGDLWHFGALAAIGNSVLALPPALRTKV